MRERPGEASMAAPLRSSAARAAPWFVLAAVLVGLDQWTKHLALGALSYGERVPVTVGGIAADSLGAQLGAIPWAISKHFVDVAVLVSDDDIRAAQRALWNDLRLVVEPGGAAAYAALLSGAVQQQPGEKMVVVLCGSNCDPNTVM